LDEATEDISSIQLGFVTIKATITRKHAHYIQNGSLMTDVDIADKTGTTKAVWFSKQPKEDLVIGSEYNFSGTYRLKYGRLALQTPKYVATGKTSSIEELARPPFILHTRDSPFRKESWKLPDWVGGAIVWILIVGGVIFWIYSSHHHSPSITSPQGSGSITGNHNNIPEIRSPGALEANSSCTDVSSTDYDYDDDVLCTRPDGSKFYTNYAGGDAADSNSHILSRP
jgi:hypothetical protein